MIVLDTSILIDSLSGMKRSARALRGVIEAGQRIVILTLVLYEWLRGPRMPNKITAQEALFPSDVSLPFGTAEAMMSAKLYRNIKRPRGREIDIAIAACALVRDADLGTLNQADLFDIPGLRLARL